MTIIRQILSWFVVPDLRNFGTISRLMLACVTALLLFPLVSGSSESYLDQLYMHAAWVAPTLLAILIKGYLFGISMPHLYESKYIVLIVHLSNLLLFTLIDYVLLGERPNFWQHFFLFNIFSLSYMYIEAARRYSLVPSLSEARLSALTARIRPHFLFNSLNAAISLIRLRPYDAETLLENLANLFRAQLRDGSQSSTLGQEIEWAQEYIAIEQIRMGHTRVQVMWQHHAPDDAETPHLLLQPLLENAVFHGIESTHRPGCISVLTTRQKHWIYLRVENPYVPTESEENAKPHKGNSMALHNLRERLSLMYDNDAQIKSRQFDGIFRVDIRLPYRKKSSDMKKLFG
ncbi:Inner membrane protein ypdA [Neisseria animaloris]|uniref:Inner membrane protein ypdA n=1 Tax=Neisseria animaloris TaxID=326522 RepID=A0A1X3CJM0_9NEIS|nr:histidine kinase [Neisseria animaloris]MDO5073651.1 histidine kinase [Neisseria animaloris]OSI07694.1 sensor histidine kinase [Neisseria animaloris]VEH88325.1 Inner membrane protein ypdA [Neisseria animaloris]VEJ21637.1 Inner membrane protein ypdA [Neisseria animaloris]